MAKEVKKMSDAEKLAVEEQARADSMRERDRGFQTETHSLSKAEAQPQHDPDYAERELSQAEKAEEDRRKAIAADDRIKNKDETDPEKMGYDASKPPDKNNPSDPRNPGYNPNNDPMKVADPRRPWPPENPGVPRRPDPGPKVL